MSFSFVQSSHLSFAILGHFEGCFVFPRYFCVCVSKQTAVNKLIVRTKTINLCFQVRSNGEKVLGADPGFFLGAGAPLRNGVTDW